jgi:hypothetical protein
MNILPLIRKCLNEDPQDEILRVFSFLMLFFKNFEFSDKNGVKPILKLEILLIYQLNGL